MKLKPVQTAYVKLWNDLVGVVHWPENKNHAVFEFDPHFIQKGLDISPIVMGRSEFDSTPVFEFPNLSYDTFKGLPGLLANSLPDTFGNSIIDAWLTENNRDPNTFNSVERLCYIGKRGIGALEFEPTIGYSSLNQTQKVDVEKLLELTDRVLNIRNTLDVDVSGSDKENNEAFLDILRVGTSAGGQRAKAIVAMKDNNIISGQSEIPEGYDHWIIKFDGIAKGNQDNFGNPQGYGRVEQAYYLMAQQAGLEMMECKLFEENNRAHFMTKRFDRDNNRKFHMQSLCSMAHFDWDTAGEHSYEQIFWIIRELNLGYNATEQQYKRMIFNILSSNMDDHVKNFAFLMDESGQWELAPAFDVMFSYNPKGVHAFQQQLKVNGKQADFNKEDLIEVGKRTEVNNPEQIIDEVYDAIKQWPEFAQAAGVKKNTMDKIGKLQLNVSGVDSEKSIGILPEEDLDDDMEM